MIGRNIRWVSAGIAAAAIIAGCTAQVSGTAQPNSAGVAQYAAEASAARITSSSVAAAATSSRQAAATSEAITSTCSEINAVTGSTIDSFNDFIDAANASHYGDPVVDGKANKVVGELRDAASSVAGTLATELPGDLSGAASGYVDATRLVADRVEQRVPVDPLNEAIDRWNAAKNAVQALC